MTANPEDIQNLLLKIRYDATAIQAKVSQALEELANLDVNLPDPKDSTVCVLCGVVRGNETKLQEHMENVHGVLA